MKCHESVRVGLLVDDELDVAARRAVERHVDGCARCGDEQRSIVALRDRLRDESLRFALPPGLAERVSQRLASARRVDRGGGRRWWWFGSGAFGGAAATAAGLALFVSIEAGRTGDALVEEVVAAHGRAATNGHLIDVASSDGHTVKPWLSARLDYSPPVPDLAADGFELLGGRLDRLDRAPVATLVYRYGRHTIDVFVRPAAGRDAAASADPIRGYRVMRARGAGMDWVGISDVDPTVLANLMRRLGEAHPPTAEPTAGDR